MQIGKNKTWIALLLDFFTGKYLWDVYQSSKQKEAPPEEPQQISDADALRHSPTLLQT